jgi:uroporphyrinogen decarboxylase
MDNETGWEIFTRYEIFIMKEFREVRKKHNFFEICQTPELSCEVTLQPIDRYDGLLDASIIFSDILVIPQALGMEVQMLESKGPHFPFPLQFDDVLEKRLNVDVNVSKELSYVYDAISLTRHGLNGRVPLIGFAGAPWTLAAYMIEGGGGNKMFLKSKSWLIREPEKSHRLLKIITKVIIDHLLEQIRAGAQAIQIFDSWAGELSPDLFREFSLPYIQEIAKCLKEKYPTDVPLIIFAKGAHFAIQDLLENKDFDVISLDWSIDIKYVLQLAKATIETGKRNHVVFQGNLDPVILYGTKEQIITQVTKNVLLFLESGFGYVCNLGHGILPDIPPENLKIFLETVKNVSEQYFKKNKK